MHCGKNLENILKVNINMTILEHYLTEYYSNEIVYLKKYFNMTDEQKKEDLIYSFSYLFPVFLGKETDQSLEDLGLDEDDEIDIIKEKYPEEVSQFADWLTKQLNVDQYIMPQEKPSWHFMTYEKDIKNQWLVHFSNEAFQIEKDKTFKYGVEDLTKLGLTTYMGKIDKQYGGYNFAYRVEDVKKYGRELRHIYKYTTNGRGVIFRASGVLVYHWGDEEKQVIFYGKTATNIISFFYNYKSGKWRITFLKSGNKLVEFDELEDLLFWVQKNYDQYRRQLEKI